MIVRRGLNFIRIQSEKGTKQQHEALSWMNLNLYATKPRNIRDHHTRKKKSLLEIDFSICGIEHSNQITQGRDLFQKENIKKMEYDQYLESLNHSVWKEPSQSVLS